MNEHTNDFAESKRHDCQIIAFQTQRWHSDDQSRDGGGQTAGHQHTDEKNTDAEGVGPAQRAKQTSAVFGGKISRDIRADRHEPGVTQRELPRVTVDKIQTDRERDVNADEDDDLEIIRVDRSRVMRHERAQNNGAEQRKLFDVAIFHGRRMLELNLLSLHSSENSGGPEEQDADQERKGDGVAVSGKS